MNKDEQIKWWKKFCNSCRNEDCKNCKPPIINTDSQINEFSDFFEGTPFASFFRNENIIPPSNYIDMRNEMEKSHDCY